MTPLRFSPLIFLLALCSSIPQAFAAPAAEQPVEPLAAAPTVTMASGVVLGTTMRPLNQPTTAPAANAYLGIPFADSPPERFSPPKPAPPWSSPLQAQSFKPSCMEQIVGVAGVDFFQFGGPLADPSMESEDCLYLNIYTPPGVTATSKKAVMFWIYGGNLQFGHAGKPEYDGSSLATTQDVIVVTFNYRTNIFGFPNSPDIPDSYQNAGFLDQRFALKWVQENIAQFGGDPSRVLLFGESAGGESTKQLLANPPNPLPFSSAIMQSEQSLLIGDGWLNFQRVLRHFKCPDTNCLKSFSAEEIKAYIVKEELAFPPVNNGKTSVSDVRPSIKNGKWAKIPVMIGSNFNEARFFLAPKNLTDGQAALDAVFEYFNITSTALKTAIKLTYGQKAITDLLELVDRILTDLIFTCPTASLAKYLSSYEHTVYRYRYDAVFPSVSKYPNHGAYHTAEIPTVFGTYPLGKPSVPSTQQQIELSALMQRTWAGFAKNPEAGVGWPVYKNYDFLDDLAVLGRGVSRGVEVVARVRADYACPVYDPLGDLFELSYR